ncbi:MAG: hypothetical protein AABX89_02790 [Candidatus Thermoplasmatota archaeon]
MGVPLRNAILFVIALAAVPATSACSGTLVPELFLDIAEEPEGRCFVDNENGTAELQGCLALPANQRILYGTVTWGWSDLPCTAEAMPPIEDVIITFSTKAPAWMSLSQPSPVRITPDDQLNPATYSVEPSGEPRNAIAHRIVKPFSLTASMAREPTESERADLAEAGGLVFVLVRATSSESYGWLQAYDANPLRFDGRGLLEPLGAESTKGSEVVPLPPLALAALALAVLLVRRRADSS